jgi:addiction module HigA family antidote
MTELKARRPNRKPTHPGAIWKNDILPALDLSVAAAARDMGVSRQGLHKVLRTRNPAPVTPDMALRFARLCGDDEQAGLWIRMQAAYDLWEARKRVSLKGIPVHAAA